MQALQGLMLTLDWCRCLCCQQNHAALVFHLLQPLLSLEVVMVLWLACQAVSAVKNTLRTPHHRCSHHVGGYTVSTLPSCEPMTGSMHEQVGERAGKHSLLPLRFFVPLQDERLGAVGQIPELQFLDKNSKFKVGGRTFKCFKLMARAVRREPGGAEVVLAQVESESFKVRTKVHGVCCLFFSSSTCVRSTCMREESRTVKQHCTAWLRCLISTA